jgi:hypothetical protein
VRSHSQQQADSKWLSGDNRARIGQEFRFDELFSLIRLAETMRHDDEEQAREHRKDSKPGGQSHVITYHSRTFAAI